MRIKYLFHNLLRLGLAASLAGCASVGYYGQAISGHLDIMQRRQPITSVLADPATPEQLRTKLQQALAIREFASTALGLPESGSYYSYADLERRYAVWNVIATPPLSLTPRQWCFPFAGCLQYRGYYAEAAAREFAAKLAARGDDTYVVGATAYSTLGWFDDPVLSTMLHWDETQLAQVMFHELAHEQLFIKNDTEFNEAFAETVAITGTRRWLVTHGSAVERQAYELRLQRHRQLLDMIFATREELSALYNSDAAETFKRQRKQALLDALVRRYRTLRDNEWHQFTNYDRWFDGGLNNAKLAAVASYWKLVPDFMRLLAALEHDLSRFYQQVASLARCPPAARRRWLAHIGPVAECPVGKRVLANISASR